MAIPIKEYQSSYEQYLSELKDSNPGSIPLSIDTFWTQKLSHRIDDTISAINNRPEKLIPFSISYGIAISHPKPSNDPPHDIDSLSNKADKAMYQMKSEHKQIKFS
jgi:GGDEF domain-containing protein